MSQTHGRVRGALRVGIEVMTLAVVLQCAVML